MIPGQRVRLSLEALKQFPFYAGRTGVIVNPTRKDRLHGSFECLRVKWDDLKTTAQWHRTFLLPVGPLPQEGDGSGMEDLAMIEAAKGGAV